jgi:hypothetical protein
MLHNSFLRRQDGSDFPGDWKKKSFRLLAIKQHKLVTFKFILKFLIKSVDKQV